ncbi:hypothetical protein HanXRQr2_Chr17g0827391 [Helianthus annuus]|uniref:Uncharacterized protein n=1 Tax=Helianthus annuus TaxID=4232 RepID=A0A9K3GWD0_HELAN|nr:hypothetical protein HanXRQr2_Chr17g0827391 [Helianthus annuus]KAJ0815149.1 hypothetical protein HanPSC8_Chr17g0794181 [Helianthus annuus]
MPLGSLRLCDMIYVYGYSYNVCYRIEIRSTEILNMTHRITECDAPNMII